MALQGVVFLELLNVLFSKTSKLYKSRGIMNRVSFQRSVFSVDALPHPGIPHRPPC